MPQPPMKHIVETNTLLGAIGAVRNSTIVHGAINPDPFTNPTDVKAGSIVQAIDIQLDFGLDTVPAGGSPVVLEWYIWYNINGAQTQPTLLLLGQSHLKNQIFFTEGHVFNSSDTKRMAGYRFILRIPRAYQQINDGDVIELVYKYIGATVTEDSRFKFIYKEYFP